MIRKLRAFMRNNSIAKRTVYPAAWYFMNKVLHWRSRLLQAYGIDILLKVQEIAKKENVQSSPYFGTLLGLVRDGRLIKHDTDMDFIVSYKNKDLKDFYSHLKSAGFIPERMMLLNGKMVEFTMCYNVVNVDFFLVGESSEKDKNIFVFDDRGEARLHTYPKIEEMSEMKTTSGAIVMIPKNATEHLENEYGNWRVPDKNWDARRGPSFKGLLDRSKCVFECIRDQDKMDMYFETHFNMERIDGCLLEKMLIFQ